MYISKTDNTAVDRGSALLFLDDTSGTDRATIYIPGLNTGFQVSVKVTGDIVDNGTWLTIPVSWVSGGLPSNDALRSITGVRNGEVGPAGTSGITTGKAIAMAMVFG